MVETAFTLGFTLMLVLGAVQVAVMGFLQMQLDGATFFFAHNYSAGSTNSMALNTALQPLFAGINVNITPVMASPPLTDVPVNFTQWGSLNERFGGASIVRPQRVQAQSSMTLNSLSVLGRSITLSSGNADGKAMVGNHDDDAQGVGFDSQTAYNSMVDPLFSDDQNVPPYYFNLSFIWYCSSAPPWGPSCSSRSLRALGLAEYLKNDNYQTPGNGIGPNSVFQDVACHQRIFADLDAAFPAARPSYVARGNYDEVSGPASVAAWNGASFRLVYSWDVMPVHGEGFSSQTGQLYPLHPDKGCQPGGAGA